MTVVRKTREASAANAVGAAVAAQAVSRGHNQDNDVSQQVRHKLMLTSAGWTQVF